MNLSFLVPVLGVTFILLLIAVAISELMSWVDGRMLDRKILRNLRRKDLCAEDRAQLEELALQRLFPEVLVVIETKKKAAAGTAARSK